MNSWSPLHIFIPRVLFISVYLKYCVYLWSHLNICIAGVVGKSVVLYISVYLESFCIPGVLCISVSISQLSIPQININILNFIFSILDFQISLPSIPQFENKSWNFLFWNLKSHYRQYHSFKIKVEILYSHFGFLNLTTTNTTVWK